MMKKTQNIVQLLNEWMKMQLMNETLRYDILNNGTIMPLSGVIARPEPRGSRTGLVTLVHHSTGIACRLSTLEKLRKEFRVHAKFGLLHAVQYPYHVRTEQLLVMLPNPCRRRQFCRKMRPPAHRRQFKANFVRKWGHWPTATNFVGKWGRHCHFLREKWLTKCQCEVIFLHILCDI